MITKCANPACATPFRYLREGTLFTMELADGRTFIGDGKKPPRKVEHYWLCGPCSQELTLACDKNRGVIAVPRPQQAAYYVVAAS